MTLYAQPGELALAQACGERTRMVDLDPGELETTLERVGRDNSALVMKIEMAERPRVHPTFGGLCAAMAQDANDVLPHASPALAEMLGCLAKLCQYDAWCAAYLRDPKPARYWDPPEFPKDYDRGDVTAIFHNRNGAIRPFCTAELKAIEEHTDEDAPPPYFLLMPMYENWILKNMLVPMDNPGLARKALSPGWRHYPVFRHRKWRLRTETLVHNSSAAEHFKQQSAKPPPVHMDAWIGKFSLSRALMQAFNQRLREVPLAGRVFECGVEEAFEQWTGVSHGIQRQLLEIDVFRATMPAGLWERTLHEALDEYGKSQGRNGRGRAAAWSEIAPARMRALLENNPGSHLAHLLYRRHRREMKWKYAREEEKKADARLFEKAARARAERRKEMIAFLGDLQRRKSGGEDDE